MERMSVYLYLYVAFEIVSNQFGLVYLHLSLVFVGGGSFTYYYVYCGNFGYSSDFEYKLKWYFKDFWSSQNIFKMFSNAPNHTRHAC